MRVCDGLLRGHFVPGNYEEEQVGEIVCLWGTATDFLCSNAGHEATIAVHVHIVRV